MLRFLVILCLLILPSANAMAASTTNCTSFTDETICKSKPGCTYSSDTNQCTPCSPGQYSQQNSNNCSTCPAQFPNSDGNTDRAMCYMDCTTEIPIENGKKIPTSSGRIYYGTNGSAQCTYDIQCDTGYKESSQNTCIPEDKQCTEFSNTTCSNSEISGKANWNLPRNDWDYSQCKCTKTNQTIANGKATITYQYNGTIWSQQQIAPTLCNVGYCKTTTHPNECSLPPAGYYSDDTTTVCKPCPMGSTSTTGEQKTKITYCYVKPSIDTTTTQYTNADDCKNNDSGATCFCDKHGCFTLPHKSDNKGYNVKAN